MPSDTLKKIAVVGANSMVGSRFCEMAEGKYALVKTDLNGSIPLDITDKKNISEFFKTQNFDCAVLFSAFTDVDSAEIQRGNKNGSCWRINVDGTGNIADSAAKFKKKLIIISTDFVFDGTAGPYSEEDPVGPDFSKVSWYGLTKIESEKKVNSIDNSIILRISYPYRAYFPPKEDFARSTLRKYREGNLYPMFSDQTISPTFIDDVFLAIDLLISEKHKGIFHLGSPDITTPFEFTKELIHIFGENPDKIQDGLLTKYLERVGYTPRPIKGGMKVEKITKLGFKPTDFETGIKELFSQIKTIDLSHIDSLK